MPVLVSAVTRADVPVYLDAVGTIKALNTVTVRPQVDGKLLSVNFKEGDDVKKGDVLARIDPVIYQAQLGPGGREEGTGRSAARQFAKSISNVTKDSPPRPPSTNSRPTPNARWSHRYTALVQADQAAIDNAQAMLGYTTITAPLDGRTGIRMVDEGNIVHASDTNSASW